MRPYFLLSLTILFSIGSPLSTTGQTYCVSVGPAGAASPRICGGTGSPEAVLVGSPGDIYLRSDGTADTQVFNKETGVATNTGGVAQPGGGTTVTASSTNTFTNKTYDADAGAGNVLTISEKRWLAGARCDNATASSPQWSFPTVNPGAPACDTGTNTQKGTLDFADGAATLSGQTQLHLPADFTGAMDARMYWYTTATTGDVVWQLATVCVANAETGDPVFNTASTVTDPALATASQYNLATITAVTTTGCAAGELLNLRLFRDPAHAADTLAATARLIGIELTIRRGI